MGWKRNIYDIYNKYILLYTNLSAEKGGPFPEIRE
jgi:hypothetical protein